MRRSLRLWFLLAGTLFVLCPRLAPAQELDEILDAHAAAMGWSRDEAPPGAVHIRAKVEGLALEGRAEAWTEAPLYGWSRLELGPLSLETGYDGDEAWIMDRNGVVRKAEASEETGTLMESLINTGAFVLKHPPVPIVRRALEPDESGRARISLKVWGAEPQILIFDPESWFLVKSTWNNGQMDMRSEYSDYRQANGVWIPWRTRLSFGDQMSLDLVVTEVKLREARGKEAYARPPQSEHGILFHGGSDSGALPMQGKGLHIVLEGTLDSGHRGHFLLDTGAGSSIIATKRLDDLGLVAEGDLQAMGAGGMAEASLVQIERLELGRLEFPSQSWMSVDLAPMGGRFDDRDFLGVLGYDTLNRVIIEIDYDDRVVRLHRREGFEPPRGAREVPLRMDGNIPTAPVSIEGIETWVHLDTGSNGSLDLTTPFVKEHELLAEENDRGKMRDSGVKGVGGHSSAVRGPLHHFELGGFEFEELPTNFSLSNEGIFANSEIAGVLGAEVLSRFHLYLDYEGARLWLVPGKSY